jgi:hypothetical protein
MACLKFIGTDEPPMFGGAGDSAVTDDSGARWRCTAITGKMTGSSHCNIFMPLPPLPLSASLPAALDRRTWIAGMLAGTAAWARASPATAAPPQPALDDRMPAFWQAYDASRTQPEDARIEALLANFFQLNEALYRRAGGRVPDDTALRAWLPVFDPMAPSVRQLHARLVADLPAHVEHFVAALPDFDPAASPMVLMPSLFRFDAHLEPDGAQLPLFFGADGIVRYHGPTADLGVLMSHEIFHCYQAQRQPALSLDPQPTLFSGLWLEGTATYASERLNPGASLRHVLLDDEALWRDGPALAPRIATEVLARIDSTADADLSAFLSAGHQGDWPARAGYYIGLLAARRIGRTLGLREMASLPAPQVRERLAAALAEIGAGPAPAAKG